MTNHTPRVNFSVKTQAHAYREGMLDAFDLLITMLEEGGTIDYLLEGIEHNARPETVARMNAFYAARR